MATIPYTVDGQPTDFGKFLYISSANAIAMAQDRANQNGAPVAVFERGGWFAVSEWPDDCYDRSPLLDGWTEHALVEPRPPWSLGPCDCGPDQCCPACQRHDLGVL